MSSSLSIISSTFLVFRVTNGKVLLYYYFLLNVSFRFKGKQIIKDSHGLIQHASDSYMLYKYYLRNRRHGVVLVGGKDKRNKMKAEKKWFWVYFKYFVQKTKGQYFYSWFYFLLYCLIYGYFLFYYSSPRSSIMISFTLLFTDIYYT